MANEITGITDVIADVKRFTAWVQLEHAKQSKLRAAGLIAQNPLFDERANASGDITSVPFLNALSGNSVPGTDDATVIEAGQITGGEVRVPRFARNHAWSGAGLTALTSGADIMGSIANGVAGVRAREEERLLMLMLQGVTANAIANDLTTMVAGSATAKMDANMIIDAAQTKGDRKDALNTLVVHSAVHAQLQKDNVIVYVPGSEQNVGFETYLGKRLVVSDSMPTIAAGVYASLLTGSNVFSVGDGNPPKGALAYVENHLMGTGSGVDTLVARRVFLAGVAGYDWTAGGNPADAALSVTGSYIRKVDPALLPFVIVRSKPV